MSRVRNAGYSSAVHCWHSELVDSSSYELWTKQDRDEGKKHKERKENEMKSFCTALSPTIITLRLHRGRVIGPVCVCVRD